MKQLITYIKQFFVLGSIIGLATSCEGLIGHYDKECDYTVRLRYDYNEENSTTENMIEYYVYTIDEYIFDENNILYMMRHFTGDPCTGLMDSELDLPPGRYSVIGIGNQDERSAATDVTTGQLPVVGVTHRDDMRLSLDNAEVMADGTKGESEPLYYGYKTFTVEEREISSVRVDVINAHMTLKFRITWKDGTTPDNGSYYALLETVPSEYSLMPQYIYPAGSFNVENHDCDVHDEYPSHCNNVIHHIPYTCHGNSESDPRNLLCHRHNTYLNADKEMWGEFVSYRTKNATPVLLKVFAASDGQNILPSDIDVQAYLDWEGENRDHTLKQAYELDIVIDGNKITITPLDVGDWDEGGNLSGR